jgi:pimeloyl-ACP methyl ester carboxylesterase
VAIFYPLPCVNTSLQPKANDIDGVRLCYHGDHIPWIRMMSTALPESLNAPRHSLQTRAAGEVAYYADATASGRPLLLIHSINAAPTAREVAPLFDHYRRQRPVYALELPGFGFSERGEMDYRPTLYADTILEFCREVIGESVDALALSTSSEFLARAALAEASRFNSLVLVSPTGMGSREPPSGAASDRLRKLFSIPLLSDGLYRGLTTRASIRYFLDMSFESEVPVELVDQAWATARQPGAQYAPFCFLSMSLFTTGAADSLYQPLSVPTLVLYDRDPNINFDRLEELVEHNPNIVEQRIAPTRGLPHWEQPVQTFHALDRFWAPAGQENCA